VVYLAADERFSPKRAEGEIAALRSRYGLPERFLFYLGGLDVRKNLGVVLQALRELPQEVTLVVAGRLQERSSPVFPAWPTLAQELGVGQRVRFLGTVPEAEKRLFYQAATVFVFPSRYEGFGLDPLEAMACGTPVVCSNATSLPEVVGEGGVLVDPDDPRAWAEAVGKLWDSAQLRAEYRDRGLAQVQRFSWRRTAEQTLAVYERLG